MVAMSNSDKGQRLQKWKSFGLVDDMVGGDVKPKKCIKVNICKIT